MYKKKNFKNSPSSQSLGSRSCRSGHQNVSGMLLSENKECLLLTITNYPQQQLLKITHKCKWCCLKLVTNKTPILFFCKSLLSF